MKQKRLEQWAKSKKVQREIQRRLKLSENSVRVLKDARKIEDWILNKPVTI